MVNGSKPAACDENPYDAIQKQIQFLVNPDSHFDFMTTYIGSSNGGIANLMG
jgi:hypothetical protein